MDIGRRDELVTSLREIADLLESIDDPTDLPQMNFDCYSSVKVYNYDLDPDGPEDTRWDINEEATKQKVISAMRLLKGNGSRAGRIEKEYYGDTFYIKRKFSAITVTMTTERDAVCTSRVVGTETKPVMKYIDTGVTQEVPVVEWDCDPILAPTNE